MYPIIFFERLIELRQEISSKNKDYEPVCYSFFKEKITFSDDWGLNPGPCIHYALSISTELSSRGQTNNQF